MRCPTREGFRASVATAADDHAERPERHEDPEGDDDKEPSQDATQPEDPHSDQKTPPQARSAIAPSPSFEPMSLRSPEPRLSGT